MTRKFLILIVCALVGLATGSVSSFADTETDIIPIIAKVQEVAFEETGENEGLDGRLVSTAFGGPQQIAPPTTLVSAPAGGFRFSDFFTFNAAAQVYEPNSINPANQKLPPGFPAGLENVWVYAFVVINDGGEDGTEGGADFRQKGIDRGGR
jgi:hypothetical protein